jgi:hypothetical protein
MIQSNDNHEIFSQEALFQIDLIPDQQDYQEQIIDSRIKWLTENDTHGPLKNFRMVDYKTEMDYFLARKIELEQERDSLLYRREQQFQQQVQETQVAKPPNQAVILELNSAVQEKNQLWSKQEVSKLEKSYHCDTKWITEQYNRLINKCAELVSQADAKYQKELKLYEDFSHHSFESM